MKLTLGSRIFGDTSCQIVEESVTWRRRSESRHLDFINVSAILPYHPTFLQICAVDSCLYSATVKMNALC